ncbi:hypothetical protein [Streptomyces sp. MZ04]|uniref:hypothetical protein n=1 Tax=Streptomyces sp. MZ04 TaxID=2559236 RepID=UPI001FD83C92|nr:hypothetical protein [Streptomyces sp. MZ04]
MLPRTVAASTRRQEPVGEISVITKDQLALYRALHAAAAEAVHSWEAPGPGPASSVLAEVLDGVQAFIDQSKVLNAAQSIIDQSAQMSVFYQAYAHLANAAINDVHMEDEALAVSGSVSGPGTSLLRRLLRFATRNVPPETVQEFISQFLEIADEEYVRATLAQLACIEWQIDPQDAYQLVYLDSGEGVIDDGQARASKFRFVFGLAAEPEYVPRPALTDNGNCDWEKPTWHRIRDWRRRYAAAHSRNVDWAMAKAEVYRQGREPLAPYWHPDGLEAAVATQLQHEAERAASARLSHITDSVAQMALRRVQRRASKETTPFDPRHLPSARGMMLLDTPFALPNGRRIVGYVWGPWSPSEKEGWARALGTDWELERLKVPQGDAVWTWVTPLTCDQSLLSLPFSPYDTLLLRPGDTLEPETRLRDPENADRYQEGAGRRGRNELMTRHVRSLWELLTQHKRSSVRILAEETHAARPRDQRSDRRRGITDSGQVTTVWVDPDAGARYRAQRRSEGGSGYKLKVRYWRDEHERQQCPNSHQHAARQTAGGCSHDEITIPEHVVGPAGAPWSDRMQRARSRRGAQPHSNAGA